MTNTSSNKFRTDDDLIADALKKVYDREPPQSGRLEELVAALRKSERREKVEN